MVNAHNLQREHKSAANQYQLPGPDSKALIRLHTQKVQSDCGNGCRNPDLCLASPCEKKRKNRNHDDVQCRQKPCFPDRYMRNCRLLKPGGCHKHHTTDHSSDHRLSVINRLHRPVALRNSAPAHPLSCNDKRQQHHKAHQEADPDKGRSRNLIAADSLCHKGGSPDQCSQEAADRIPKRHFPGCRPIFFHMLMIPQSSSNSAMT